MVVCYSDAATGHRMFFANYVQGKPPVECADNDGHNTDAIDALTLVIPVTVACVDVPTPIRHSLVLSIMHGIRRTGRVTDKCATVFSDMLCQVMSGERSLEDVVEAAGQEIYGPSHSVRDQVAAARNRPDPMTACYIDTSFAALLFFAMKYGRGHEGCMGGVEAGLLASANAGGENVARGAALGALLGAAHGYENGFPAWMKEGLLEGENIRKEIERALILP
jgi:ADP-ribosyl-[dinitrogen reductase] hydrolase